MLRTCKQIYRFSPPKWEVTSGVSSVIHKDSFGWNYYILYLQW